MARYAEPADLIARFDIDLIGDVMADDRGRLSRSEVMTHPNVIASLDDASGRIEAALRAGSRYKVSDLTSLTENSKSHLKRIVCVLAMVHLLRRRPSQFTEIIESFTVEAENYLKELSSGRETFDIAANVDAGFGVDASTVVPAIDLINRRSTISGKLSGNLFTTE